MRLLRYLQHWVSGTGLPLHVADFVPDTDPIRQWADTFPWTALVAAIEHRFAQRFPKRSPRGRAPIPVRVLLALELLKHEVGASDEAITLCEFRGRIDEVLMDELIAIQAAAAMETGLVSPAHLVIDTFPCEQGSQRVTDATTLYKAQKKPSN